MLRHAGAAGRAVADLIVPPVCLYCRRPLAAHDALCGACWRQITFIRAPVCDRLGLPMPFDPGGPVVSAAALADPPVYDRARAVAHFDGIMRDLIHELKYADRHDARRLFGRWLAEAGRDLLVDADFLVPVPLYRWRLLSRRFNQAALLAAGVARATGVKSAPTLLVRTRRTPTQVGLSETDRRRNVARAFSVPEPHRPRINGARLVLVDDVITSGATVAACAQALFSAGAARVDVLALALVTDRSRINL